MTDGKTIETKFSTASFDLLKNFEIFKIEIKNFRCVKNVNGQKKFKNFSHLNVRKSFLKNSRYPNIGHIKRARNLTKLLNTTEAPVTIKFRKIL